MNSSAIADLRPETLGAEIFQVRHHALLRAIIDNISEGISIADKTGNFIYTSVYSQKLFGSAEDDNIQPGEWTSSYGIFHSDERTLFKTEELPIFAALKGLEARDVGMFVRNPRVPEGRHVLCTCLPVRDEHGELLGAMSLVRDIDRQRKMEEEKRRSEQRFQVLVETAQEGIWTIDEHWRTTYVNKYMAQMLGYSAEEMMGVHLSRFVDEKNLLDARANLDQEGQAPQGVVEDRCFVRKDGTPIWTSISTTPLFDDEGRYTGSLAMVTDITQRRAAEEQIRQLNAQLEQRIADRTAQLEFSNRELEAFAYTVAHDLRAPLRSVASFSDALVEDCGDKLDAVGRDYLRRIVNGSKRMADLIDGILSLSRVNSTELAPRKSDLSAMAYAIVEQLQGAKQDRSVRVSIQDGLTDEGDPQLLRVVLENLLGNAWKFTRDRNPAEIEFSATRNDKGVRVYQVRDNGAGFDMAYRDKLFGVFQRLHAQKEFDGNGVGLATVQRIVRRHGGRVWGEGEPGMGARFFFTLNEFPLPPRTTSLFPSTK
ncbi:MAG TPA: PAS domain S-box protein [Myxococcaceae bacterium]|nr:PAS domain S-box protein [Myxococcaceae bacterium]